MRIIREYKPWTPPMEEPAQSNGIEIRDVSETILTQSYESQAPAKALPEIRNIKLKCNLI